MKKKYFLYTPLLMVFLLLQCSGDEDVIEPEDDVYTLKKLYNLPVDIQETSGLLMHNGLLWTHNDSGNDPIVFGLDIETGDIVKHITLTNVDNTDWEDLAQNEEYIFIGDFGNNNGSRKDLAIYRIAKAQLTSADTLELEADIISFYYSDQTNFTAASRATEFDCEAMIVTGDSILLYTKDWINGATVSYWIPNQVGDIEAQRIALFSANGLVTGADYNRESGRLVLVGYENFLPFVWIIDGNYTLNGTSSGQSKISLVESYGVQMEGIALFNSMIYLTCENSLTSQALFLLEP